MASETRECLFCREQWQAMLQMGISIAALQAFYARYKYLIMSRHLATYHEIGTLLAAANKKDLPAVTQQLFELMMSALALPATRGGNVNALLHISGYLKHELQPTEKMELVDTIESYRCGEVEFDVPATLLREHFQTHTNAYIEQQVFLQPGVVQD